MILCKILAGFFALTITASAVTIQVELSDKNYEVNWSGQNDSCEETVWEITVNSTVGVGLNATVDKLLLNSDDDFYLALSTENATTMSGSEASVAYLSGNLSQIPLTIPIASKFYLKLSVKVPCPKNNAFTLTLSRLEEITPRRPPPPPNPNPPEGIPTEIPVHFSGKTVSEFKEIIAPLQTRLKQLVLNWCKTAEIDCDGTKPPEETVFLREIGPCPDSWEDHEHCVKAWMAIFVTLPPAEYELTPEHLSQFWKHLEDSPNVLQSLGIKPHDFPSMSLEILWWLLWILIAVIIAGIFGYILWRMEVASQYEREFLMYKEEEQRKKDIFDGVELRRKPPPPLVLSKKPKLPDFMLSNGDTSSALSVASTPPATKKHALRPILKNISTNEAVSAEFKDDSPSPMISSFQDRPAWFMLNKGFEEDEEEDILFSNGVKTKVETKM